MRALALLDYDLVVKYIPSEPSLMADAISRSYSVACESRPSRHGC
jgi:hypothetical protein